jgi:type II secretory pathway pseudopilin PulG
MAKRAEEKERRRQERLEAERAAQAAASRKRTFQIAAGVVFGLIVIAVIVVVATAGGGGKSDSVKATQVSADAKTANCTYKQFKSEGRTHTTGKVNYKTNPPTSGNHNPTPAQDGIYSPGNSPAPEAFVHSLEHGRIEFQYAKGTSAADQAKLKQLAESKFNGTAGYHTLMFENDTNMPSKFAATAWTRSITCDSLNPQSIKALTAFRNAFTDKGPEFIP